jgi:hypothetical protein
MRARHLFVVAAAFGAFLGEPAQTAPNAPILAYSEPSHPSMPPRRIADCVTYVLLDNKCTADWYKCSDNGIKGRCVRLWNDCCTLPGNPARTTIVSSPQTP